MRISDWSSDRVLFRSAGSGLCWAQSPDKRRNRRANLVRTVLLDEMGACDRDFGLVWPCAAEVAYSARGQGSRLGVDEEFRNRAFAEPAGIVPGDRDHVGRGACDRDLARPSKGRSTGFAGREKGPAEAVPLRFASGGKDPPGENLFDPN